MDSILTQESQNRLLFQKKSIPHTPTKKYLSSQHEEKPQKSLPQDKQISIDNDSIVPDMEEINVTGIENKTPTKKSEQKSVPAKKCPLHSN